jgi:hypothetical protein
MAHTAGPWQVRQTGNMPSIDGADGRCVASTGSSYQVRTSAEAAANARLIAAAPQMLDALKAAEVCLMRNGKYQALDANPLVTVRLAIAAAEGSF